MLFSFIVALVSAFIFTLVLSVGFKRRGPGPINGLFYFFLLILFISWATGTWLYPVGPVFGDVPWVGFLVTAFVVMLFIAVLVPAEPVIFPESKAEENATAIIFGVLFWVLIIVLGAIAISKGLLFSPVI